MGDLSNLDIGWRSALMFAVCLPMLVIAAMLATRRAERAANIFLAGFLLVAVVAQIPQIIGFPGFYQVWPGPTFAPFNVELYAGPLVYLHADRLMQGGPLGWRKWTKIPSSCGTGIYSAVERLRKSPGQEQPQVLAGVSTGDPAFGATVPRRHARVEYGSLRPGPRSFLQHETPVGALAPTG